MTDPLIGTRLGQYLITEVIAKGGMAVVYKAYQETLDRVVAVKVLGYGADRQFADRFKREARAMAVLQHPNILPIYDFGEGGNVLFLALQYVEHGRTFHDLIGQPLQPLPTLQLLRRVCDALQYAHERSVVHRDIKPGNILLPSETWPMLADFGIAKLMNDSQQRLTLANQVVGTAAYMAPEQATGRSVDARTDLYAMGVILYQAMTGRVPFEADTPMAVLVKHIYDELPPPSSIRPDLPASVEALITRALQKDPDKRFQSANEMAEAFDQVIEQLQLDGRLGQPRTLYQTAVQAIEQERWDDAVDRLGRLVAIDPSYGNARELLDTARARRDSSSGTHARPSSRPNQLAPSTVELAQAAAPPPSQPQAAAAPPPSQPQPPVAPPPSQPRPATAAPPQPMPAAQPAPPAAPAVVSAPASQPPAARKPPVGLIVGGVLLLVLLIGGALALLRGNGATASNPTAAAQPTAGADQPTVAQQPTAAADQPTAGADQPTVAQQPVPEPAGTLVLQNDFQDNTVTSGLEDNLRATDFQRGIHAPGYYHMLLFNQNDTRVELLPHRLFRDFSVQADLKDNSDDQVGTVTQGLVFRARDAQRYYALLIDPRAGKFSLIRQDGAKTNELIGWTASPLIQLNGGDNRLRIDAAGDQATFYLNGGQLGQFSDATYPQGLLGLAVANVDATKPHMHFDNLAIWNASAPPKPADLEAERADPNGDMRLIAGGEFIMGSNQQSNAPVHVVGLPSFYIDRTEVTNAAYRRCVADGKCSEPRQPSSPTHPDYFSNPKYDQYPVMQVTWEQARSFCTYAGKVLPTEAQWEKAAGWDAQNSYKSTFPWGDDFKPELLNSADSGSSDTTPVGQFGPGQNDLADMAGNLAEWTSSILKPYPYDEADGREDFPAPGERAFRGGSWAQSQGKARVAGRQSAATDYPDREIGFRCALTP